jgi:hypothetical protein
MHEGVLVTVLNAGADPGGGGGGGAPGAPPPQNWKKYDFLGVKS